MEVEGEPAAHAERAPLENPAVPDFEADDPLREPHPGEPGVDPTGYAAPIENPGWGRAGAPDPV